MPATLQLQQQPNLFSNHLRRASVRRGHLVRDGGIDFLAISVAAGSGLELAEKRSIDSISFHRLLLAAFIQGGERCLEVNHGCTRTACQQGSQSRGFGGSAAQGDDPARLGQQMGQVTDLRGAKCLLSVQGEDLRNGKSEPGLDAGIEIGKLPPQPLGEQAACRALARAHEAGEHNALDSV